MRDLLRLLALFVLATATMAASWGAGFAVAQRLERVPGLSPERIQALVDRVGPLEQRLTGGIGTGSPSEDASSEGDIAGSAVESDDAMAHVDAASDDGVAVTGAAANAGADAHHFNVFWEAWDVLRDGYVVEMPVDKDITYGAIRGSLRALQDPYTLFTDPVNTEVQRPDLEGEFEGIGAFVANNEEGLLVIQTPMRGQPAERAGIVSGDIVIEVDGEDITELDVNESVLLIRGPKGTVVELTIVREGVEEPFVVAVTRDRIEVPSVAEVRMLEEEGAPDIGYMQLTVFAAETRQELIEAIDELEALGAQALILDLRNNPGGFLSAAVGVASEFLDSGVVTIREDSQGRRNEERVLNGGHALNIPLVVLVNGGSASASEIVAGAIRDYDRGVLVGETTFGKGSVQNVHPLSDGSQLRVTVEIWRTPNGSLIHKEGIDPDFFVAPAPPPDPTDADNEGDAEDEGDGASEEDADGDNGAEDDAAPEGRADVDPDADPGADPEDEEVETPPDLQLLRAIEEARVLLRGDA